jgi:hypothetical protein
MKEGGVIAIVAGVVIVLWFAVNKGLIQARAVPVGAGVYAPQPAQNYSGYLAASTAPGVSGALNSILSGVGGAVTAWLKKGPSNPAPAVSAAAPGMGGYLGSGGVGPSNPMGTIDQNDPAYLAMLAGNTDAAAMAYDQTTNNAFAYDALAADNAYDPNYSLSPV